MNAAIYINQTSGDVEYGTDPIIIEAARQTMGGIDLDPASAEWANRTVKAKMFFTLEDDGMCLPWTGRVWLNHPFGRNKNPLWIAKLLDSFISGYVDAACCITFACTSEAWFKPLMKFPQCYLQPRTNYYLPDGTQKVGVTKGSVVTYLGPNYTDFMCNFERLGSVMFPAQFVQQRALHHAVDLRTAYQNGERESGR